MNGVPTSNIVFLSVSASFKSGKMFTTDFRFSSFLRFNLISEHPNPKSVLGDSKFHVMH
jgi:hypothetical protein